MLFAMLITFLGVGMIVRPPFIIGEEINTELMIGATLAILSAIFLAGAIVMTRHLHHIHYFVSVYSVPDSLEQLKVRF